MPNANYRNGTELERATIKALSGVGFWTVRAGGSRGLADVVALRKHWFPLLIQCKADRHSLTAAAHNLLWMEAEHIGALALVVDRTGPRRTPRWWLMTALRAPGSRVDSGLVPIMDEWWASPPLPAEHYRRRVAGRSPLADDDPRQLRLV